MTLFTQKAYSGTQSVGAANVKMDTELDVEGKNVLLVEDILDTGRTLSVLKETMFARGAKDVKIAAFMDKPARRVVEIKADYSCFDIEDRFVVGYGLDYDRNVPQSRLYRRGYFVKSYFRGKSESKEIGCFIEFQ